MTARWLLSSFVLLLGVFPLSAQGPLPQRPPTLFYLRLAGPAGMKATLFQGNLRGETFDTPCVVGFRPGYTYRFALWNVVDFPGQVFFPSLEVRGSLLLSPSMKNSDYPAALVFTAADFEKSTEGALLHKVITLEHPETAIPKSTTPQQPLEVSVSPQQDPIREAHTRGLPLALMQLGGRRFTADELVAQNAPGTILPPGQNSLGPPRTAPWLPFTCYPLYDPIAGPFAQADFYRIPDGGDVGTRAGYNGQGRLRGVDPSDTIAEYQDAAGTKRLAVSNRVFLCIPRFIIVRGETLLARQTIALAPATKQVMQNRIILEGSQPLLVQHQNTHIEAALAGARLSGAELLEGLAVTGRIQGVHVRGVTLSPQRIDQDKPCPPPEIDRPLVIIKWPDKCGALVGEVVTFFLRVTNQGSRPVTNVAVVDSLTNRFEYVPGSAHSDHEVNFTTQANDAGSLTLRWEVNGELRPGESALVSFQVRVR